MISHVFSRITLKVPLGQLIAKGRKIRLFLTKADVLNGAVYWKDESPTISELRTLGRPFSSGADGAASSKINVKSAYITDSMSLLDNRLKLLGGLRFVEFEDSFTTLTGSFVGVQKSSSTNYQLGIVYDITKSLVVFANTATSFNPNRPDPATGLARDPENTLAYELGVKLDGLLGDRLSGSVSLFQINKQNFVRTDYNPFILKNLTEISDEESKGIDAELFFDVNPNWQLILGYVHLDAKVIKSDTAALGLPLEGAPPDKLTIWTSYGIKSGPLKGLRFGGGGAFVRGPIQQFGLSSNRFVSQKSYSDLNAFVRYDTRIQGQHVTFGFNATNLTNEFYFEGRAAASTPRQFIFSTMIDF